VAAVVVKPKLHQSNTTKLWQETLSHDAERARHALNRSATFKAEQRMYHDKHGEGTVVARSAEGEIEMKFDNGEVHKYNLASQRKLRPILENAHELTASALFDMVDTDSSNSVEREEFVYMHSMVLKSQARALAMTADAKRGEDEQRRAKHMVVGVLAAAFVVILAQLGGMVGISFAANEATKESHVRGGGVLASLDGEVVQTAESTVEIPLYCMPALPAKERESLKTMLISYNDPSLHDFLVAEGHIAANDTGPFTYPRVAETVTVTSFKKYNNTAVDIGIVSTEPGETRVVRILNGAAYLLTKRADGSTNRADLCAGTVSCAAFTVDSDLGAALKEQAIGNLSAAGFPLSEADHASINGHTASIGRQLRPHHGREASEAEGKIAATNPDGTSCWVCTPLDFMMCSGNPTYKMYHNWILHTEKQALQVCYNDAGWSQLNSRGYGDCGTFCALPGTCPGGSCHGCSGVPECAAVEGDPAGRRLFEPDTPHEPSSCEDATNEVVAKISEAVLGRTLSSCAELKDIVGACDREAAKMHCPASCGLCNGVQDRHARRALGKCVVR
jgi:hypothetical protein